MENVPKTLKPVTFFVVAETSHRNQNNFMKSGNKIVYAEGTFLWWGLYMTSFRTIVLSSLTSLMLSTDKAVYAEDIFFYGDYENQMSKLQHIYMY